MNLITQSLLRPAALSFAPGKASTRYSTQKWVSPDQELCSRDRYRTEAPHCSDPGHERALPSFLVASPLWCPPEGVPTPIPRGAVAGPQACNTSVLSSPHPLPTILSVSQAAAVYSADWLSCLSPLRDLSFSCSVKPVCLGESTTSQRPRRLAG